MSVAITPNPNVVGPSGPTGPAGATGSTGSTGPGISVTTKGDLQSFSTVAARLAVGANNTVLTADSTEATGLKWVAPSAGSSNVDGKNGVLNSNFSIWQRGTSIAQAASATYTADRWNAFRTGSVTGATISRQVTNDTTNLSFIQYAARVQRDSGNTSTAKMFFSNSFESVNSIPFAGKTVAVSFYARAGANFSSASNALGLIFYSGTGTDQQSNTGYTGATSVASTTATLTTTWQRFTATGTVGTSATEVSLEFSYTPVGTAGTNDYYEITGVQLEIASSATAYAPNSSTFQGELFSCQRYYYVMGNNGVASEIFTSNGIAGDGAYYGPTVTNLWFQFPQKLRVTPTFTQAGNFRMVHGSASTGVAITGWGASGSTLSPASVWTTATLATGTAGAGSNLGANADGTARLMFSAEL